MNNSKEELARLLAASRPIQVRLPQKIRQTFGHSGGHATLRAGNDGVDFNSLTNYDSKTHRPSQIDWRRVARDDEVQARQYDRATAITLWLIVDLSQTMHFGTQRCTKLGVAGEIVASLLKGAQRSQDRVGLLFVGDSALHMCSPAAPAQLMIPALRGIVTGEFRAMKSIQSGAFAAQLKLFPGSIAVVISDLQESHELLWSLIPRPGATLLTTAILIDDLRERELPEMPPFFGLRLSTLISLSSPGRSVRLAVSGRSRHLYALNFDKFARQRAERLYSMGIRAVAVDTSETLSQVLSKVQHLLALS